MRYVRRIALPLEAVEQLSRFVNERYPSLRVAVGAAPPSNLAEGTIDGELPESQAAEVDTFIFDLQTRYH